MAITDKTTDAAVKLPEISTGDPATVNDAAPVIPVGSAVYFKKSDGSLIKCRYVQINSTVAPVEVVGPTYWKDRARTIVTCVMSEGVTGTVNSIAGVLLNKDITNAYYGFIQVAGPITMAVVAATAAGDALIGAAAQATAKVAANTAPTNKVLGFAESAIDTPSAGLAYVNVVAESL